MCINKLQYILAHFCICFEEKKTIVHFYVEFGYAVRHIVARPIIYEMCTKLCSSIIAAASTAVLVGLRRSAGLSAD